MKKICWAIIISFIHTGITYAEVSTQEAYMAEQLNSSSSQPVGHLTVSSVNGNTMHAQAVNVGLARGAVGAAIRSASKQGAFVVAGIDGANQAYHYDLGQSALAIPSHSLEDFLESSDRMQRYGEMVLDFNGSRMAVASTVMKSYVPAVPVAASDIVQEEALPAAAILRKLANGHEMAAGVGGMNLLFGLENVDLPGVSSLASSRLSNPYLDLMPQASSVGYGIPIGDGMKLKLGMATSALAAARYGYYRFSSHELPRSSMAVAELSKSFQDGVVAVEMAKLDERNAMLGTQFGAGFGLSEKANTMAFTVNAAYRFSDQMALAGYISQGSTRGFANASESLITRVSNTKSQAFGAGITYLDPFLEYDRLMISVSSPLKTTAGEINLNVPSGIDGQGNVVRDDRVINLAKGSREVITEASYYMPVSKDAGLNATLLFRQNADNIANRGEAMAAVRYTFNF